ncbi:neuropeptide S receptor-like [Lytechinus variegatus]|uniref:neuropeptide S receptor-like n=1 Tax=Lytechinus variegatus TaxID=7654 RepID=UPI001BB2739F|nr:neuropeptide S receptor-like [Lytechinus variegatus]XP_041476655.1 neuropeptide S receptor-like [Lytechinus variegatus]
MTTQLNFDPEVMTTEALNFTDSWPDNDTGNGIVDRWSLDKHIQLAILWILFTLIIVGNGIVLIALWLVRHKKSRLNFFITNLAVADICVGLFSVGLDIIDRQTPEFTGGDIACKLYRYVQAYVVLASSYQLVALSFDRFFAIVFPMDFTGSGKRSTLLAAGGWLLPSVLCITSAVVFQVDLLDSPDRKSKVMSCWPAPLYGDQAWKLKVYSMYVISSFFYIPLILITFCYVTIIVTIWKRAKKMGGPQVIKKSKNSNRDVAYEGLSKDSNCTMPKHRASSRGLIPKAKVKTIKMTICIVLAYICCFLPFSLFYTLEAFGCINPQSTAVLMATPVLQNLPSLNSATNPFIYGIFSTNVCKELRRIPAINWIADKVPCCTAWKPLRFGRTTYQTNTHTTEFNNFSDGHTGSRGRNIVSMSGKVVDGPSRDDSRNSTTSPM